MQRREFMAASDGYAIADGHAAVSDAPGFGIAVHEDQFAAVAEINFDLEA